jgi:hypothetical protein
MMASAMVAPATGRKTGFSLAEPAAPYDVLKNVGVQIMLASPQWSRLAFAPDSRTTNANSTRRFKKSATTGAPQGREARKLCHRRLPGWPLPDVGAGGRGELDQADLILPQRRKTCRACRPRFPMPTPWSAPFVAGKNLTGFTDVDVEIAGMTKMVPFLVKDGVLDLGATLSSQRSRTGAHGQRPVDDRPESRLSGPTDKLFIEILTA